MDHPSFTLGIEEEYLLVDKTSRDLVPEAPQALMAACEKTLQGQVSPEFLRCQIEVATRVCNTIGEARADLGYLRTTIAELANAHGLAPIAASTHPFAKWADQHHTDKERYNILARDLQVVVRRMLICGMHVHVAIEDEATRIDIFNQVTYFLPHLLALTTSSPFWQGTDTGLNSYRLIVFDALPRTGLPPEFSSFAEYERSTNMLMQTGAIEDRSKLWWDLRPSTRYPTLEMRICDVCTRMDDAIAVASLYVCLCRMLYRLRRNNQRWRDYSRFLINENRWRAQRYGVAQGFIDFGQGKVVDYATLLEELLDLVREDAEFFGCESEIEHCRTILKRGTSADNQRLRYNEAIKQGASTDDALCEVVDGLVVATVADCGALDC